MQLEITYERWKATVNITDYMAGQLPFRGATPEDSDCGDSSSVDFLIEKVESTSDVSRPLDAVVLLTAQGLPIR